MRLAKVISLSLIYSSNFFVFFTYTYFGNQLSDYYGVPITSIALYFTIYGFIALFLYIPSGILADKYNSKTLIAWSSLITALIYVLLAFSTNPYMLGVLMALYAISSVLLFYSPWLKMIKGLNKKSNKSFAWVYTVNAIISLLIAMGANFLIGDSVDASHIRLILILSALLIIVSVIFLLFVYKDETSINKGSIDKNKGKPLEKFKILNNLNIWIIGIVCFLWYFLMLSLTVYNQYLSEIYFVSDFFVSVISIVRLSSLMIFAGPLTIVIAQRVKGTSKLLWYFSSALIVLLGFMLFFNYLETNVIPIVILLMLTGLLIYGAKSIYYSMIDEIKIDERDIGFILGFIAFVIHIPDAFGNYLFSRIIYFNDIYTRMNFTYLFLTQIAIAVLIFVLLKVFRNRKGIGKDVL